MTNFQGYEYYLKNKTHFYGKVQRSPLLVEVINIGASAGCKIRFSE